VSFNFLDPAGRVLDERAVARDASAAGISLRTGCFCNPGAGEGAFGLTRADLLGPRWARAVGRQRFQRKDLSTVDDYLRLIGLPTGGAIRVSLGIVSTLDDVGSFLDFAERAYRDRPADLTALPPRHNC
jgi:selenocysteine lyase/cysteine desulfurase